MTDKEYIKELETLLFIANKKVEMLSRPYGVVINDREEEIRNLIDLKNLLEEYQEPVRVKIKIKRFGEK